MCMTKYVVSRTMLGNREQGWCLWNGKEVVEMTSAEIKRALEKDDAVYGLEIGADGELTLGKNFFTRNIMEHRQVGNYKPMVEEDNLMANVFYIVTGKTDNGYEVISTKFERTTFSTEKVKIMLSMGIISAGAKLEDDKVILPDLERKPLKPEKKAEPIKTETKKEAKSSK